MTSESTKFWGLLELMGHRRLAGEITKDDGGLIRIDLPSGGAGGVKALTVWQPWSSMIIGGMKPYEFRRWAFPAAMVGQRIVIHAGSRPMNPVELRALRMRLRTGETALDVELARRLIERIFSGEVELPLGAGLGTAMLGEPKPASEIFGDGTSVAADSSRIDHHLWAWPMLDPKPFEPIVPARGFQQFWHWPHDVPEAA